MTQVKMVDQLMTLNKIMGPQWRCPLCHKRFTWSGARRALILDPRSDHASEDPLIVLPIRHGFDKSKDPIKHVVGNHMEQMIKFLQLTTILEDSGSIFDTNKVKSHVKKVKFPSKKKSSLDLIPASVYY